MNDEDVLQSHLGISDEEIFTMYRILGKGDIFGTGVLAQFGLNFPVIDAMNMKAYGMRELQFTSGLIPPSIDSLSQSYTATKIQTIIDRDKRNEYAKAWGKDILVTTKVSKAEDLANYVEDWPKQEVNKTLIGLVTTEKRDRLWRWNRYNHLLESGMATIKGRNVFVGQKMLSSDKTNLFWTRGLFDPDKIERNSKKGMEFYCVGVEQHGGWGQTWRTSLSMTRGANMSELETYYNQRHLEKAAGVDNQIFARNTDGEK